MNLITKNELNNTQRLLERYILADDSTNYIYWEKLSVAIQTLVHKAVLKREVSDLEDFEEECVLAIWSKISSIKNGVSDTNIDNLEAFIRRAVHNRYCDAIRRKRPKWYNLKLELQELFSGRNLVEGLAMWQLTDSSERLCGYKEWENLRDNKSIKCRELIEKPEAFKQNHLKNSNPNELPTYKLATAILDYCKGPIPIDVLTNVIVELTQIKSSEPISIDSQIDDNMDTSSPLDYLVSGDIPIEKQIVDANWFGQIVEWFWSEFTKLNIRQKKAVVYGMEADLVMALISSLGINTVAEALGIPVSRLAAILKRLPLPDSETAEELGLQSKAIPSIRFKAWGRIRRRTKKANITDDEEYQL